MKISKDAIIGLVVIGAVAILVWGVNFLKGFNMLASENVYYAKYKRVDGLKNTSPVTLRGFKVGQVRSINFNNTTANYLIVEFSISNEFSLSKNTEARIVSSDIMGTKEIRLIPGESSKILQSLDTLNGSIEGDLKEQVSMQMLPLKRKAENLMSSVDSVLAVIQYVFNKENRENLSKGFSSFNRALMQMEKTAETLNSIITNKKVHMENIITNVDSITYNIKENNENLSRILTNFSSISNSLAKSDIANTINQIEQTLEQSNKILTKINSGKGSMGQLINNDTLYMNLEAASNSLTNLLIDVKNNPKKYIHFSLIDRGKVVYQSSGKTQKRKNKEEFVEYRVQIKTSKKQLDLNDPVFKGQKKVDEIYYNGIYKYTVGRTNKYKEIIRVLKQTNKNFPNAFIIKITPEK
jgi:phospholipid/cholesterol/gamma-HCH transport system substrate-binding protein